MHYCNGQPVKLFDRVRAATAEERAEAGKSGHATFTEHGLVVAQHRDACSPCCSTTVALGELSVMPSTNGHWNAEAGRYCGGLAFAYAAGGFVSFNPDLLMPVEA